jgi:transcriptional regulator GlxA family with amidase domain
VLADIIVFDGVDELDALGPLEVLRSARGLGADVTARLVTRVHQPEVRGAFGLRFVPDGLFEPGVADVVVATGGGWVTRSPQGAWAESERGEWPALLAAAAGSARVMTGVCTGAMLLARAGVVGTRRATTHHGALADLAATGATVVDERVVDDGDLITCGGVTSGIDLALWLVERELGRTVADAVATRIEYQRFRPADRGHGRTPGS